MDQTARRPPLPGALGLSMAAMAAPEAMAEPSADPHAEKDYLRSTLLPPGMTSAVPGALEALLNAQAELDAGTKTELSAAAAIEPAKALAAEAQAAAEAAQAAVAELAEDAEEEEAAPVKAAAEAAAKAAARAASDVDVLEARAAAAAKAARLMEPIGDPVYWVARWLKRNNPKAPQPFWPRQAEVERVLAVAKSNPENIMAASFDPEYVKTLGDNLRGRLLQCVRSGVENPNSTMGCYACQPDDYDTLQPFFSKALAAYHGVPEDAKHVNDWSLEGVEGLPEDGVLDLAALGLPELSMRVRVGRNLAQFPLPAAMTRDDRCAMENKMMEAFGVLIGMEEYGGKYVSITPGHPNEISGEEYDALVGAHIMFKDMSADTYLTAAGIASDWPYGRGCYISEDRGFIIWVGEEDHLRIMCMRTGTVLNEVFDRLKEALDVVGGIEGMDFAFSPDYGVVTSCPTNLGTGMRASLHIQLPYLTAGGSDENAKAIAKPLGLSVRGMGGEHTPIGDDGTVDISPSARFCIKECEIITALYKGIEQLKAAEDEAAATAPTGGAE